MFLDRLRGLALFQPPLICVLLAICGVAAPKTLMAQSAPAADTTARNLIVLLRESAGQNKEEEGLEPMGKLRVKAADGKEAEVELAAFHFLGDMHLRFAFDGPTMMLNAKPEDLARLNLTPEEALKRAVANIKRSYGAPTAAPLDARMPALMYVKGKSGDLDSSYFLDRVFWNRLLKRHPDGIVAAVPERAAVLFTPLSETETVAALRKSVSQIHESAKAMRVSSALYLYKDERWTVFQPAQAKP
jgi:hypothetical protein